jgi:hypothetical protein
MGNVFFYRLFSIRVKPPAQEVLVVALHYLQVIGTLPVLFRRPSPLRLGLWRCHSASLSVLKGSKLRSLHIHIASLFFADRTSIVRFITVCSYLNSSVSSVSLASSPTAKGGPGVVMPLCGRVYFTCKTRMEGGRSVTCTTCFDMPFYPMPQLDLFRSVVILP